MNTIVETIDGVPLIFPKDIEVPFHHLEDFPDCCGPGNGIFERAVPDRIWGLIISPSCYVHDTCWQIAEPKWSDYHQSNSIFLINMLSIIRLRPSWVFIVNGLRRRAAMAYFEAVSSIVGATVFWKIKNREEI